MDSKLKSASESFMNIVPGFLIAYLATFFILPPFHEGIAASDAATLAIVAVLFTAISLVRMYTLRRVFTRLGPDENLYTLLKRLGSKLKRG